MKSSSLKGVFSLLSPSGKNGKLTILLFHKIPVLNDELTPSELNFARFEEIIDMLDGTVNVVRLGEATKALKRGSLPPRAVALTFDDGYADWIETIGPLLRSRKMPATLFISTEQLKGDALWHERIIGCVRALPAQGVKLPFATGKYVDLESIQKKIELVTYLQNRLKHVSLAERLETIASLEAQAVGPIRLPERFSSQMVRTLHDQGFEIGAHTVRHPILTECTIKEAREEIGSSKERLEAIIGSRVDLFAYPNGRPATDYDHTHVQIVKACGYAAAVATCAGSANMSSDIFQLPRFSPWRVASSTRFGYHIARNFLARPRMVSLPTTPLNEAAGRVTPVRCLLIASTFPPIHGGSAAVYESLCKHMPAGSVRVLAAKRHYDNGQIIEGWQRYDAQAGFPVDRINLLRPKSLKPPRNLFESLYRFAVLDIPIYVRSLIMAASIVRKHRINVVCVGELVTGSWLGMALRRLFGCRLLIYVHGEEITTTTGGRLHGNKRKAYLAAADKIIAVSLFTCDALTALMEVKPGAIELIPNGVDTDKFYPGELNQAVFSRYDLIGKDVILTVGRLVARKGIDMSVRAMARISKERPNAHYLVVGQGEMRSQIETLVRELKLEHCITLAGKVDDEELIELYRGCDVFLMPNRTLPDGDTEGFGLVFREANACRKPVIGGRAGGATEAVVDGVTGILVDGNQPDEIADAVLRIIEDKGLARRMGDAGYELALANSTRQVAARFLRLCERVIP